MNEIEKFDDILADIPRRATGRLKHADRCAAFALMKRGFPQALVARTFGITKGAAHNIAQCETTGNYPAVANDWKNLGPETFYETYLTAQLRERVIRVKRNMPELFDITHAPGRKDRRDKFHPNQNAKAGAWICDGQKFEIILTDRGWTLGGEGVLIDEWWPTSQDALHQGVPHWIGPGIARRLEKAS